MVRSGQMVSRFLREWGLRKFVLIAAMCGAVGGAAAENQQPELRISTNLVTVFTNVTDKTGAIVGGLTKADFRVFEDGRPQEIGVFERESQQPLAMTLAIDTSGSTFKDRALEQEASKRFIHALLRTQDQMS